jgi:hypothetical protein
VLCGRNGNARWALYTGAVQLWEQNLNHEVKHTIYIAHNIKIRKRKQLI